MELRITPIIACATGIGKTKSALAIIRVSGFKNFEKLQPCFDCNLSKLRPQRAVLSDITAKDHVLDRGIITFFKAPNSYTGENLLEISVHGNPLNVKRIIKHLADHAELDFALPGEFTFRAYKNGKLSLSQVEGLDLFLRAESGLMLDQGIQLLQGELHKKYMDLWNSFLNLKTAVELSIDFLEDVGEENAKIRLFESLHSLKSQVEILYQRTRGNIVPLLAPNVVLVGKTNAGKSTLFNAILGFNRSIISEEEGTTRDFITEYVEYKDVNYLFVDTAGLRETFHPVEKEGIRRSVEILKRAFFKILVINPFDWTHDDLAQTKEEMFDLLVFTRADKSNFKRPALSDLPKFKDSLTLSLKTDGLSTSIETDRIGGSIGADEIGGSIGADEIGGSIGADEIGGSIGADEIGGSMGADEIGGSMGAELGREKILEIISSKYLSLCSGNPVLVERHRQVIEKLQILIQEFSNMIDKNEQDIGIISSELSRIESSIQKLIGVITPEQVLENIFKNFCIGK